jgi:hypothetical protein
VKTWNGIRWGIFALLAAGCMAPAPFVNETVPLSEPATLPVRMARRNDLIELSGCRVKFDFSAMPEEIGISLMAYNAFDPDGKTRHRLAVCPLREPFARVLRAGALTVFGGSGGVWETRIVFTSRQLGVSRDGAGARAAFSVACSVDGMDCGTFSAENVSPWPDQTKVPDCVYAAAAAIGDQVFSFLADSRRLRDRLLAARRGGGKMPAFAGGMELSDVSDGCFTGQAVVDCGTWDKTRVWLWIRSQLEQIAMSKLGLPSLESYRILLENEHWNAEGTRVTVSFRVFPYQGFELDFNSRTWRGVCTADLAFLGVSPEEAYKRAVRFVETVLSDQGVVKTAGTTSAPAQYRFEGYHSTASGTRIEIPFRLVQ